MTAKNDNKPCNSLFENKKTLLISYRISPKKNATIENNLLLEFQ
jgi:hypothetical protein